MPLPNPALRRVRHVTFDKLSAEGHNVQVFEDGATAPAFDEEALKDLPEHWKGPRPVVAPKIATLRDVVLFREGSALLPDGRYCYFDSSFAYDDWRKHHGRRVLRYIDRETDHALIRRHLRNVAVPGRCFSARSSGLQNYGHFIHDVLTRIYYEDLGAIAPGREKIIAPRMFLPIQQILFEKIFEGYEIVQAPPNVALRVEELVLPANLCGESRFNPKGIASLAKRMRRFMRPFSDGNARKVCVSRRDGKRKRGMQTIGRDFANIDAYEAKMQELGFDIVEVSSLDPEAQFNLWANTTDIVGVHGAGMMNMIMMPAGSNYVEIAGLGGEPDGPCPNWTIRCALAAGHSARGIAGTLDWEDRPAIDIERLEEILRPT